MFPAFSKRIHFNNVLYVFGQGILYSCVVIQIITWKNYTHFKRFCLSHNVKFRAKIIILHELFLHSILEFD